MLDEARLSVLARKGLERLLGGLILVVTLMLEG